MTRPRPAFAVTLGKEAVAASTPYVLVDLDDVTNFPHNRVAELHLLGLILSVEKASDGVYDIWVGVVTENDATDGSVTWVHCFHLESVLNPTDSTDRFHAQVDFTLGGAVDEGVNLNVTSGALTKFASNLTQANHVNWQNDVNRDSPVGSTTKPGVGDLVMWVEEVGGAGTIDFCITPTYEAA
jgi:hypothetical protein